MYRNTYPAVYANHPNYPKFILMGRVYIIPEMHTYYLGDNTTHNLFSAINYEVSALTEPVRGQHYGYSSTPAAGIAD